jgi:hypothetical protein
MFCYLGSNTYSTLLVFNQCWILQDQLIGYSELSNLTRKLVYIKGYIYHWMHYYRHVLLHVLIIRDSLGPNH